MAKVGRIIPLGKLQKSATGEAGRVLQWLSDSRQAMQEQHEGWFYDIGFFRGFQWTYRDRNSGRIQQVPAVPWRIRVTDNQTRPLVTQMLALLLERQPTWRAAPRGHEEDDMLAALGYEALLNHDWERLGCSGKLEQVLLWMLITGNGFWRVAWNPKAGAPMGVPLRPGLDTMAGKDSPEPEGEEKADDADDLFGPREGTDFDEIIYNGDVDLQVVSPFNMDVTLHALSLDDAAGVAQHAFIHRDILRERIGSDADRLTSDVSAEEYQSYDRQLRFDSGAGFVTSEEASEQIRVIEFWEGPTKKWPVGSVTTLAGNEVLAQKKNPYGGRYPFIHFGCLPVPGRFWFDGIVRELVPLQQIVNKALSRYHEKQMLSTNPKVIADNEAGLKETAINDQPGEVIFKKRGTEVSFITPPPVSSIEPQLVSMSVNSMQSITGVNDPLAGQNPPNVRAAIAIRFLQESGMRRFGPISKRVEAGITRAGRMLLYLHQRYTSADRQLHVVGTGGEVEHYHMRKSDVSRILDVSVQPGSLTPNSVAAKQDLIIQLLQYAPFLFADSQGQVDSGALLRQLEMPVPGLEIGLKRAQRMRAYGEHKKCMEGAPIYVRPYDDDSLHLGIHGRKLSDDAWAEAEPEAAAKLIEHFAGHEIQKMKKLSGEMIDIHAGSALPPVNPGANAQGAGPTPDPGGPPPGGPGMSETT